MLGPRSHYEGHITGMIPNVCTRLFNQVQTNLASKANLVIFNAFHAGKSKRPLREYKPIDNISSVS